MKKVYSLAVYSIISAVYFASCFSLPSISNEIYGQSSSSLSSSISLPSAVNDDNIVKQQADTFTDTKIPNQYIVVFKDNVKNPNYLINQLVKKIEKSTFKDLRILNIFQNSIKGSVVKINTQSELDKIKQDPNVKYVEQDQKIQSFA
ncbi:MAG: protease inhibitor I9 family protein, partial [Nitrososphaerales archaeon]